MTSDEKKRAGIDFETAHYYSEYIGNHSYIVVRRSDQYVMKTYTTKNLARSQAVKEINHLEVVYHGAVIG